MERPSFEVADVLRRFVQAFRRAGHRLSPVQARVVSALLACRTAVLGGHVQECDQCGERRIAYNSCRNRHCPKCQGPATAEWLEREREHLLPAPYSHVIFTLPHVLCPLVLQNPRVCYDLLFRAASRTLLAVAADPKHLGARIGILSILHTWGQTLVLHPHLHCLVPAGGLSLDQSRWISCRRGFFLSVRALAKGLRGRYLALLEESFRRGELRFEGPLAGLAEPEAFGRLLREAARKKWMVYAKPPFGSPEQVLKYLARYTHRVAIANSRLLSVSDEEIVFTYKDYAHGQRQQKLALDPVEFIRRFLLHVLPAGFVRIRRYGLLANAQRESLLARCRELIAPTGCATSDPVSTSSPALPSSSAEEPPVVEKICPTCGTGQLRTFELPPTRRQRWSRAPPGFQVA